MAAAWSDSLLQKVKEMWMAGHTAEHISKSVNRVVSRSAILGKAGRDGWRRSGSLIGLDRQGNVIPRNRPGPAPRLPRDNFRDGYLFADLKPKMCQFPVSAHDAYPHTFCGEKTQDGKPYCCEHQTLTRNINTKTLEMRHVKQSTPNYDAYPSWHRGDTDLPRPGTSDGRPAEQAGPGGDSRP